MNTFNVAQSAGRSIAQTIIANAKANHSILCWDGINSKEDLIENIRHYVSNFTGHKLLSVTFENGVLEIWAKTKYQPSHTRDSMLPPPDAVDDQEHLLSYNVNTCREIYGRMRHCGFYGAHYEELKALLTAV